MMIPTVHLNGTSAGELIHQLHKASDALTLAMDRVYAAFPNGRDYYPQGSGALTKAHAEWADRLRRVREVRDEIVALHEAVFEATEGSGR